jgi:hypothetical protein
VQSQHSLISTRAISAIAASRTLREQCKAPSLKDRSAWSGDESGARTQARLVVVKARVVKLKPQRGAVRGRQFFSAKAVDAHLRYLERDGVTKDGAKGQVYSAERDVEDGRAFLDRGRQDRHQFRFIASAEEGVELSDLRTTTRKPMQQMEADLGTKLDWIAVDHHNTGHSTPISSCAASLRTEKPSTSPATISPTAFANGPAKSLRVNWAGGPSWR